jgi:acylglycerol lipase
MSNNKPQTAVWSFVLSIPRLLKALLFVCSGLLLCQCQSVKIPSTLQTKNWTSGDGKSLPYQTWPKAEGQHAGLQTPRGVLICIHGLSGASLDFWPAGEALPAQGYLVYGVELRGMGNDPVVKDRGDIPHRQRWIADLLEFTRLIKAKHPHLPLYWMGESLGALIAIHSLEALGPEQTKLLDGVILTSPVIGFRQELPWWKYYPLRGLIAVLPSKRIMLESLGDSEVKVTTNTTHKGQMEKTPHYVPEFTLRLFGQVEKMIRRSDEAATKFQIPVLMFYTPNDVFTSQAQLEKFFACVDSKDKEKRFFPKSYHLLLHDVEREEVLTALQTWLNHQNLKD